MYIFKFFYMPLARYWLCAVYLMYLCVSITFCKALYFVPNSNIYFMYGSPKGRTV